MLINYKAMLLWIFQELTLPTAPLNWAALQRERLGNVPETTQIQYQNQSVSPLPAPGSVSIATVHPPHHFPALALSLSETVRVTVVLYQSQSQILLYVSWGPDITHHCDQQSRLCISAGHYQLLHGTVHFVSYQNGIVNETAPKAQKTSFCGINVFPLTVGNYVNANINN